MQYIIKLKVLLLNKIIWKSWFNNISVGKFGRIPFILSNEGEKSLGLRRGDNFISLVLDDYAILDGFFTI